MQDIKTDYPERLYEFNCQNCNGEFDITRDVIIHVCGCGHTTEFEINIVGDENEV